MFGIIKEKFIVLLSNIAHGSICFQPSLIDLNSNAVNNFSTIHLLEVAILLITYLSVLEKTEHLNVSVFNMITGINE